MEREAQIEAILFFKGEPVSIDFLVETLKVPKEKVVEGIAILEQQLAGRGVRIVQTNNKVEIRTAPEFSECIESMVKEELQKDLGKAGLETLAVVLYRGPVTRAQVDYIRGVNSTYMLRHLLVRGLIEKIPNPSDSRSYLYQTTHELLGHLGITNIHEMPEYDRVREGVEIFENREHEEVQ